VVGPVDLPGTDDPGPAGQEFGADLTVTEEQKADGSWAIIDPDWIRYRNRERRERAARLDPHPFMGPALKSAQDDLPDYCRDLI